MQQWIYRRVSIGFLLPASPLSFWCNYWQTYVEGDEVWLSGQIVVEVGLMEETIVVGLLLFSKSGQLTPAEVNWGSALELLVDQWIRLYLGQHIPIKSCSLVALTVSLEAIVNRGNSVIILLKVVLQKPHVVLELLYPNLTSG